MKKWTRTCPLKWWNTSDHVQVINDCGGEEGDSIPGSGVMQQKRMTLTVLTQDFLNLLPILWAPHQWVEHACALYVYTHISVFISLMWLPLSHTHERACTVNFSIHDMIQNWVILRTFDWWSLLDEWQNVFQGSVRPHYKKHIFSLTSS